MGIIGAVMGQQERKRELKMEEDFGIFA